MENLESLFKQYKPMIHKEAWKLAKKYNLDVHDISSRGYELFMKTVERYDESKANFSTYLFHNLHDLENYCKRQFRKNKKFESLEAMDCSSFLDFRTFQDTVIRLEATLPLSPQAKSILEFLLKREWELCPGKRPRKPSLALTIEMNRVKGMRKCEIQRAWNELKQWWEMNYCYY